MGLLPIDCEGMGECVDGVQFIINRKTSKKKTPLSVLDQCSAYYVPSWFDHFSK